MTNIFSPIEVDNDTLLLDDEKHEFFYSKINSLPQNIQDLLFSLDTEEKLKNISVQLRLNQKQTTELTRLVRDIIIKDAYLGDILKETQKRLSLDETAARDIANRIISEIFSPAIEDIKKLHIEKFGPPSRKATEGETNKETASNLNNTIDLKQ